MPAVDALLRLLVQNGGDELRLEIGSPPMLMKEQTQLKLFLPTVTEPMYEQMMLGLRGVERRDKAAREGMARFTHAPDGLEPFAGAIWGVQARSAWFGRGAAAERGPGVDPQPIADSPPAAEVSDERAERRKRRMAGRPSTVGEILRGEAAEVAPEPARAAPRVAAPKQRVASTPEGALLALAEQAAQRGATDLHLADGEPPTIRVDGRLLRLSEGPIGDGVLAAFPRGTYETALPLGDGRRLRVQVYQADGGRAAAVRLPSAAPPALTSLGHPVPIGDLAELAQGLVIVGGSVGSGKTTTLAALAQHRLQRRGGLVVTLEDPIEYALLPGEGSLVRQRQIGRDTTDFVSGLRESLRQDPQVIVLGELRDVDAILLALTAATTGQLVLATLHCRSASSAIDRILDAVPPNRLAQARGQLADALRAVVVQRLLPREGGGRVLAAEVMRGSRQVSSLIRDGKTSQLPSAVQTGAGEGMIPLERHLADLVASGRLSRDQARSAANDPESLRAYGV